MIIPGNRLKKDLSRRQAVILPISETISDRAAELVESQRLLSAQDAVTPRVGLILL